MGGFFSRFAAREAFGGVRLAFENLVITALEVLLVLYGFYRMGFDSGNFAMSATLALSPATAADLNLFQNVEKSLCPNACGRENMIRIPTTQVRPRITRTDANEISLEETRRDQLERLFIDRVFEAKGRGLNCFG
jgi:hypothetical protein